jgi:hypothetical protein
VIGCFNIVHRQRCSKERAPAQQDASDVFPAGIVAHSKQASAVAASLITPELPAAEAAAAAARHSRKQLTQPCATLVAQERISSVSAEHQHAEHQQCPEDGLGKCCYLAKTNTIAKAECKSGFGCTSDSTGNNKLQAHSIFSLLSLPGSLATCCRHETCMS